MTGDATTEPSSAIPRRDALRRIVTVGALTVWTVPVVQRLGQVAARAQTSPPPPPPPEDEPVEFPSNVQLLVSHQGVIYGVKFDEYDASGWGWHPSSTDGSSQCLLGRTWERPSDEMLAFWNGNVTVTKSVDEHGHGVYTMTIPAGYTFVEGYAKCGTACPAPVTLGGSTYAFSCG